MHLPYSLVPQTAATVCVGFILCHDPCICVCVCSALGAYSGLYSETEEPIHETRVHQGPLGKNM